MRSTPRLNVKSVPVSGLLSRRAVHLLFPCETKKIRHIFRCFCLRLFITATLPALMPSSFIVMLSPPPALSSWLNPVVPPPPLPLSPQLLMHLSCISLASLIDYPYLIKYTALHFIAARILHSPVNCRGCFSCPLLGIRMLFLLALLHSPTPLSIFTSSSAEQIILTI